LHKDEQCCVLSMTGAGNKVIDVASGRVEVSIYSVNSRYLKISKKMPSILCAQEQEMDNIIRSKICRGSVSLSIRISMVTGRMCVKIDKSVIEEYRADLLNLQEEWGGEPVSLASVLMLPGAIVESERSLVLNDVKEAVVEAVNDSLNELIKMRKAEGMRLAREIQSYLDNIIKILNNVSEELNGAVKEYQRKLLLRVQGLVSGSGIQINDGDLIREVALYVERSDITEEIERLRGHIEEMKKTFETGGAIGRKLDFIAQEMNREANTMGAKCHDSEIIKEILEVKVDVDKIREQVQNIE